MLHQNQQIIPLKSGKNTRFFVWLCLLFVFLELIVYIYKLWFSFRNGLKHTVNFLFIRILIPCVKISKNLKIQCLDGGREGGILALQVYEGGSNLT